jgi:DNA repair exonuclease SbcCD nuclease subunit
VDGYPDEQHIVLVGDFVYHFSYDRGALMQLYGLLVHWYQQGKTIYVLAGNHDRLGSHFVYDEAKTAFDLLNQHSTNKLYFITNPACFNIEGKQVFFLPYMLDISVPVLSDQYDS